MRLFIFSALLFGMLALEARYPLRQTSADKSKRVVRNLGLGLLANLVLKFSMVPVVFGISAFVARKNLGLLSGLPQFSFFRAILTFLLLDYSLYFWHWANHRYLTLWRFHLVHHIDTEMDVSTASRFHVGELLLSTLFRSAQIIVLGVSPVMIVIFETAITSAAQFHHSNVKIPFEWETILNRVFVTPRMHERHHSIEVQDTNSNYSTVFSFWDRIHRSWSSIREETRSKIGIQEYPNEFSFMDAISLPLKKIKLLA